MKNERIEQLAEQVDLLGECTPSRIPGRYVGYVTVAAIEKFAELIVQECMASATWVGKNNTQAVEPACTAHAINQRISSRLGVEID